jgi:hypothetical protein
VFGLYFVPSVLQRANIAPAEGASHTVLTVILAGGLLVGPFIASAIGFLGGAVLGLWFAARVSRSDEPRTA